jgi:REP element-mobilizing transposase RayT
VETARLDGHSRKERSMPYWRLYYHLVWATRQREPLLTPEIELSVHNFLVHKCAAQRAYSYAVNGMPDHVHVIAAIPPTIAVATFAKNLKGSSSHFISKELGIPFAWQQGYSAFSVSELNLGRAVQYVHQQKAHHQNGTTIPALERLIDSDEGPPRSAGDLTQGNPPD